MIRFARILLMSMVAVSGVALATQAPHGRRHIRIEDYFALREIADPRISPDGAWIAYTVKTRDLEKDRSETRLWMVSASGAETIPMTAEGSSADHPRWSPDGRYLSFLSDRKDKKDQVWALDRRGGDAIRLTDVRQGVEAFEWSPNARHLVLVIRDPKPGESELEGGEEDEKEEAKTPEPWVIDRLQFKRDKDGYLDRRRTHLYRLDVESKQLVQLTFGDYDDSQPAWSPDGRKIAFVSNRSPEPDANYNTDLWLVPVDEPAKDTPPLQITANPGSDRKPVWHPGGRRLAYITTTTPEIADFSQEKLAVIEVDGAAAKVLTEALDRNVFDPLFSADGSNIYFELEDQGEVHLAAVPVTGGGARRMIAGRHRVEAYTVGADGTVVALISKAQLPGELFVLAPDDQHGTANQDRAGRRAPADASPALRQLTHVNREVLMGIELADVEKVRFASDDGTEIEAFLYKPPGFDPESRYPTVLWLHGGPMAQYDWGFDFEPQLFAANGYLVVLPNPRGSTGYGLAFTSAIWADWGNHDTRDVLAAVDHAVGLGFADPERLGVGGWSYGGILTNYVITSSQRFRAAISGASGALWVANYGHDHYQHWYEMEFGLPWRNRPLWERLSPFNRVERITTPTLWIGGERDWNVPIQNSEQMYQAMKRLGRETLLVVYPEEHHSFQRPSYFKDRFERFLGWYDKYLKKEPDGATGN